MKSEKYTFGKERERTQSYLVGILNNLGLQDVSVNESYGLYNTDFAIEGTNNFGKFSYGFTDSGDNYETEGFHLEARPIVNTSDDVFFIAQDRAYIKKVIEGVSGNIRCFPDIGHIDSRTRVKVYRSTDFLFRTKEVLDAMENFTLKVSGFMESELLRRRQIFDSFGD